MTEIRQTPIPGCFEIRTPAFEDARGRFVKVFDTMQFDAAGLETALFESFYSVSKRGVIRGLHFKKPPLQQAKFVYCVAGRALDAVVDLRVGSPTYGQHACFELSPEQPCVLYLPVGLAHGFQALEDNTTLVYTVTSPHTISHEAGILWNSAGIPWTESDPILSDRDRSLPRLQDYESPFVYGGTR